MKFSLSLFSLGALAATASCANYKLAEQVIGKDFYSAFHFEAIADPSGGRVEYVNQTTAVANNLTYASHSSFVMRADHTTVLDPNGPGRQSVRIRSNNNYGIHAAVFDIEHIPQGCATWPGLREKSDSPSTGQVDIIEGVNDLEPNLFTLHTTPNCSMPNSTDQTGVWQALDCDTAANGNSGCGVKPQQNSSYGPDFNANKGGWYAIERTDDFIKIWFWPRDTVALPRDVECGSDVVDTSSWGTPTANYPNTSCDIASHFGDNSILINLTLCGGWAASSYAGAGCPGECVDYVNNNPEKFVDSYWEFKSVRVYQ